MSFHFHVCPACFTIMSHKELKPEPCAHHDCKKCGEEVERNGWMTYRGAHEEAMRLKAGEKAS